MLSEEKVIDECNELIRFDYDAIGAYDAAIDAMSDPPIREQLVKFRADHERHVTELSGAVRRLGGDPAERPGARGVIRKTMTKVAGLAGEEQVLRAMRSNEEVLNNQYASRANDAFPADVLTIIQKNYSDEQRHLAWVESALKNRVWEHRPGAAP